MIFGLGPLVQPGVAGEVMSAMSLDACVSNGVLTCADKLVCATADES